MNLEIHGNIYLFLFLFNVMNKKREDIKVIKLYFNNTIVINKIKL